MKKLLSSGDMKPLEASIGSNAPAEELPEDSSGIDAFFSTKKSPSIASTVSTTSATSENLRAPNMLSRHLQFHSDCGIDTSSPVLDKRDTDVPTDLPSPIKPTVATSKSLPIMPLEVPPISTLQTQPALVQEEVSHTMTSPATNGVSSGLQTAIPKSFLSQVYQPLNSDSSNPEFPNVVNRKEPQRVSSKTPPNTPFSNPCSPDQPDLKDFPDSAPKEEIMEDKHFYNPTMALRGHLHDVFGYPLDLSSDQELRKESTHTSPKDPNLAVTISSDINDDKNSVRTDNKSDVHNKPKSQEEINTDKRKENEADGDKPEGKQDKLEDPEQKVAACWNHRLERPKTLSDQIQKSVSDRLPSTDATGNLVPAVFVTPRTKEFLNGNGKKDQRKSLYSNLKIPMIDDEFEDDLWKLESSKVPSDDENSAHSDADHDFLGSTGAAELAEQLCEVTSEAGHLIAKELERGLDYLTQPENTLDFTWIDAVTGVISIGAFYFDLVSDCLAAYYMFDDPNSKYWFRVTFALIILPLILANGFSFYWYWFDERICQPQGSIFKHPSVPKYVWALRVLAHITLQASVIRQIDIIYYGTMSVDETLQKEAIVDEVMEAALVVQPEDNNLDEEEAKRRRGSRRLSFQKKKPCDSDPLSRRASVCSRRTGGVCARGGYVALWIHAERDAANVDLLLSLVQDAPLLILHLYILTKTLPEQAMAGKISHTIIMQMLSMSASSLTLAWSVASFVRAVRLTEPALSNLSLLDLLLLSLAHFCSIAGQVMGFGLFASKLVIAFSVVVTLHWFIMTVWILVQLLCLPKSKCARAVFAHDQTIGPCSRLDDVLYSSTMGLIFLFTFVDVSGIAPRTQNIVYHIFRLIEEAILLTFWFIWVDGAAWYHWLPLFLVPVFFGLNLFFDGLYEHSTRPVRSGLQAMTPQSV